MLTLIVSPFTEAAIEAVACLHLSTAPSNTRIPPPPISMHCRRSIDKHAHTLNANINKVNWSSPEIRLGPGWELWIAIWTWCEDRGYFCYADKLRMAALDLKNCHQVLLISSMLKCWKVILKNKHTINQYFKPEIAGFRNQPQLFKCVINLYSDLLSSHETKVFNFINLNVFFDVIQM